MPLYLSHKQSRKPIVGETSWLNGVLKVKVLEIDLEDPNGHVWAKVSREDRAGDATNHVLQKHLYTAHEAGR